MMNWSSPGTILSWLAVYLVVSVGIGYYYGRQGSKTEEGYLIAGRRLGYIPVALSFIATTMSGGIYLGTVGLWYRFGVNLMGYAMAYCALVPFTAWLVGRRLWVAGSEFNYMTPQDFYSDYYRSHLLRWGAAIVSIIFLVPYFASNGVALGIVLEQTAGVPYSVGVWLMIAGTLAYSLYGGLSSVSYTDVFQGIIALSFGVLAAIILMAQAGGYGALLADPQFSALAAPTGVSYAVFLSWMILIGFSLVTMPDRMTRVMAASGKKAIRDSSRMMMVLFPLMVLIFIIMGMSLQVLTPGVQASDQAVPAGIGQFAPYLVPLMVIVVWATGMSTIDSGLIGTTAMFTRDIYRPYIRKGQQVTTRESLWVSRILVLALALFSVYVAGSRPPFIWNLIGMAVGIYAQFTPLLIGALYWKRGTKLAAEISWVAGIILTIALTNWGNLPPFVFPGVVALIPNAVLYVLISLATQPLPREHLERFHSLYESGGKAEPAPAD